MIAFEMARQLYAQGHEVPLLALFEPTTPGAEKPKPVAMPLPRRVFRYLKAISSFDPRDRLFFLLQGMKQRGRRVKQEAEIGAKERLCKILLALGQPLPRHLRTFHRRRNLYGCPYPAAARTYKPQA
jgi:hypothetical protein